MNLYPFSIKQYITNEQNTHSIFSRQLFTTDSLYLNKEPRSAPLSLTTIFCRFTVGSKYSLIIFFVCSLVFVGLQL